MIVESALLTIHPGRETDFEAAYAKARSHLAGSVGHLGHELRRSIEAPNRYLLTVRWDTLEDHTVGFRGSPAFASWRALLGPFFAVPPAVEHYRDL
ncbi:MAG: antibiotic biosynthesis monooxygenase [Steroidobacteraceae bacterium]|jgi:heme-degrading monooxygenase HmoA